MSWLSEHGAQYAVPVEITGLEGIEDLSWRNDTCPSLGFRFDRDSWSGAAVWCEHPDPDRREYGPGAPRFVVVVDDADDGWSDAVAAAGFVPARETDPFFTVCETDDASVAARALVAAVLAVRAAHRSR